MFVCSLFLILQDNSRGLIQLSTTKTKLGKPSSVKCLRSSTKDDGASLEEKGPTQGDELRKLKSNWSSRHPRCATTGAIRYFIIHYMV